MTPFFWSFGSGILSGWSLSVPVAIGLQHLFNRFCLQMPCFSWLIFAGQLKVVYRAVQNLSMREHRDVQLCLGFVS